MELHQFVLGSALSEDQALQIQQAQKALDIFTDAFNAGDLQGMDRALHFPHVMLSGGDTLIWDAPDQHPADFFIRLRETGWCKTCYESRVPVWVSEGKVHFLVKYVRTDAQGQAISVHTNVWIVTRKSGKWALAVRSY